MVGFSTLGSTWRVNSDEMRRFAELLSNFIERRLEEKRPVLLRRRSLEIQLKISGTLESDEIHSNHRLEGAECGGRHFTVRSMKTDPHFVDIEEELADVGPLTAADDAQSRPISKLSRDVVYRAVMNDQGWLDGPACALSDGEETNVPAISVGP